MARMDGRIIDVESNEQKISEGHYQMINRHMSKRK